MSAQETSAPPVRQHSLDNSSASPVDGEQLTQVAVRVLTTPNAADKASLTHQTAHLWRDNRLQCSVATDNRPAAPARPARDDAVQLVEPRKMKSLGKGNTLQSRQRLVHSLVHIESWAVDLSWDIIARFGNDPSYRLPRDFFDDFVRVAEDECRHHELLRSRLEEMGSFYGAFPAHDALWDSAAATAHSLPARLAIEHCTHEARGLDVMPATILKFRGNGDEATAKLLEDIIYKEEITHCAAGVRWLKYLHTLAHESAEVDISHSAVEPEDGSSTADASGGTTASTAVAPWMEDARQFPRVEQWFHSLVKRYFKGNLKPPFNEAARAEAGFGPEWYMPIAAAAPGSAPAAAAAALQPQASLPEVAPAVPIATGA
ncbi:g1122 [Coccomyxa viridis]|uniref:G1122 protein n=1 Tax=Coccomyxa viridis TaxID=1274662 RepID=A0ABP1FMJ4_9CHLO